MENNNYIQNELLSVSPFIAGLQKVNVFSLPEGYFDQVASSINATIHETGFIDDIAKYNSVSKLPAGYFNQLADRIMNKIRTLKTTEHLEENNPLPYLISNPAEKNIFNIPGSYFSNFSDSVIKKIKEGNKEVEISPLLQQIKENKVFEAPAGYFEQLPLTILKKTRGQVAKVVHLTSYRFIVKYAVAAVFIGIISFTAFKYLKKPAEINSMAVAVLEESIEKGKNMDEKIYNEALNNLSEEEIASYLEKNGTEADVALLTSSIDSDGLPSQEDYLADEQTLENFLTDIKNNHSDN
jgi:hypothetical protein